MQATGLTPSVRMDPWPFLSCPLAQPDKDERFLEILQLLPSKEKLSTLCEAYLENMAWLHDVVDRSQLLEELVPSIYRKRHDPAERNNIDPHDVALLLVVCALGEMGDLAQDDIDEASYAYFEAARSAMAIKPLFPSANLATIQALFLAGVYSSTACFAYTLESAWMTINVAKMLAISVSQSAQTYL